MIVRITVFIKHVINPATSTLLAHINNNYFVCVKIGAFVKFINRNRGETNILVKSDFSVV